MQLSNLDLVISLQAKHALNMRAYSAEKERLPNSYSVHELRLMRAGSAAAFVLRRVPCGHEQCLEKAQIRLGEELFHTGRISEASKDEVYFMNNTRAELSPVEELAERISPALWSRERGNA